MNITTERIEEDGCLILKITIKNPIPFNIPDTQLRALNHLKNTVDELIHETDKHTFFWREMVQIREDMKNKIFIEMINLFRSRLNFTLDDAVSLFYKELFQWNFQNQEPEIKNALINFGFHPEKYYFDNDLEKKRNESDQEKEFNIDIDDGDDEDYN